MKGMSDYIIQSLNPYSSSIESGLISNRAYYQRKDCGVGVGQYHNRPNNSMLFTMRTYCFLAESILG